MVRWIAGLAALVFTAAPAAAQIVDWSQAGGDMFGRPAAVAGAEVEDSALEARMPTLSQPYMDAVARAADRHGLDPRLLHAIVIVESAYRRDAVSPAGAAGLTQLMPGTAADLGVSDRFDIDQNLSGGAEYFARQLLRFKDLSLALAAYNAGPARVARLGRIPDIRETQDYVRSVIACFLALTAGRSARNSRDCQGPEAEL